MNRSPSDGLRFGSLLVHRPGKPQDDDSEVTASARAVTLRLRDTDPRIIARVAAVLRERLGADGFDAFFGPDVVLVPAPSHAPASFEDQRSPPRELVREMARHGLGTEERWLGRIGPVSKSAWVPASQRPSADDHYETISVTQDPALEMDPVKRITIVDDVITSGATLHACAKRIRENWPTAEVVAFAAVRTLSDAPEIAHLVRPIVDGRVILLGNERTQREP